MTPTTDFAVYEAELDILYDKYLESSRNNRAQIKLRHLVNELVRDYDKLPMPLRAKAAVLRYEIYRYGDDLDIARRDAHKALTIKDAGTTKEQRAWLKEQMEILDEDHAERYRRSGQSTHRPRQQPSHQPSHGSGRRRTAESSTEVRSAGAESKQKPNAQVKHFNSASPNQQPASVPKEAIRYGSELSHQSNSARIPNEDSAKVKSGRKDSAHDITVASTEKPAADKSSTSASATSPPLGSSPPGIAAVYKFVGVTGVHDDRNDAGPKRGRRQRLDRGKNTRPSRKEQDKEAEKEAKAAWREALARKRGRKRVPESSGGLTSKRRAVKVEGIPTEEERKRVGKAKSAEQTEADIREKMKKAENERLAATEVKKKSSSAKVSEEKVGGKRE